MFEGEEQAGCVALLDGLLATTRGPHTGGRHKRLTVNTDLAITLRQTLRTDVSGLARRLYQTD